MSGGPSDADKRRVFEMAEAFYPENPITRWRERAERAEGEVERLRAALKSALAAWHHEAHQGDGFADEHVGIYTMARAALADGQGGTAEARVAAGRSLRSTTCLDPENCYTRAGVSGQAFSCQCRLSARKRWL